MQVGDPETWVDQHGDYLYSYALSRIKDPTELLEQKEFWEVFTRCLSDLPARQARAFQLREMDGLDCSGICNGMGITASNCWVILYRARMNMRHCIQANWFDHQQDKVS